MVNRLQREQRARYTRTGGRDILINSPEWFPSSRILQPSNGGWSNVGWSWLGSDQWDILRPGSLELVDVCNRANRLVVGTLVSLPWRLQQSRQREGTRLPLWMRDPQLVGSVPGPTMPAFPFQLRKTSSRFWFDVLTAAHLHGIAWITFDVDPEGAPVAGTVLQLDDAMVNVDVGGDVTIDPAGQYPLPVDQDGYYRLGDRVGRLVPFHGPGVITSHGASLGLAVTVRNYITGTLRSGVPAGYLKVSTPNFDKPGADKLRDAWMQAHGGDQRGIAVLNSAVEFQPLSISPIDAQAKDMANLSLLAVAHAFNMSAYMLDAEVTSSTYANIQDRRQDHVDHTVAQFAQPVMETLSALQPYGTAVEVDYRGYLLTDAKARTDYYAAGITDGWLTSEEARALEGLPPTLTQEA